MANSGNRVSSAWMRSAICCAIVPLGTNTAASHPSSAAIFASNAATSGPSP